MEKNDGRFKKGERRSPETEFKPGSHWRPHQPFREKAWLEHHYLELKESAGDIAREFGVKDAAIFFWLRRHEIPRRSISEARAIKRWGASGEDNPMFGKRGPDVPSWRGGVTAERQAFYSSIEWKHAAKEIACRDGGACRRCGETLIGLREMALHHVIPFPVVSQRANPDNIVTLCLPCHHFVHSKANVDREFIGEEV